MSSQCGKTFKCVVKNCIGQNVKDITLFRIPMSDFEAWCHNLQLDSKDLRTNMRVCSRHFHSRDIGIKKLRIGVRPTLNLGHDNVIQSELSNSRHYYPRKCSIFGCTSTSPPSVLFQFPTDREKARLWIDRCHLKMDPKSQIKKYICGKHFDKKMVGKGRLLPNAIPNTIVKCTDCKNCRKKLKLAKLVTNTCENIPISVKNNGDNHQMESLITTDYEKCIDQLQSAPLAISCPNRKSSNVETCEDNEDDVEINSLEMDTLESFNQCKVENSGNSEEHQILEPLPINNIPNAAKNSDDNSRFDSVDLNNCENSMNDDAVNCIDYEKFIDNLQSVPLSISCENSIPYNVETCKDHENNIQMDTFENTNPSTLERCEASDSIFLNPLPIVNIPNIVENSEDNLELRPCENAMPYVIENCVKDVYDVHLDPLDMNGCRNCRKLNQKFEDSKNKFLEEKARKNSIIAEYKRKRLCIQQEVGKLMDEATLWKKRTEEVSSKIMLKSTENEAAAFAYIIDPKRKGHCTHFQLSLLVKLNEISRQTYRFMREELNFNLPSEHTLYRWTQKSKSITQESDSTQNQ